MTDIGATTDPGPPAPNLAEVELTTERDLATTPHQPMEAKTVSELPEKQQPVTLRPAQHNPQPPLPAQPPTPLQLPPHLQVDLSISIK